MSAGRRPELLVIAGGGTGGHLFPGVAVAEAWLARHPKHEVLFVGTERGIEARTCPKLGLPLELIQVQRLKGGGVKGWLAGLSALPRAWMQSRRLLAEHRPGVILGVGGYASGPVVFTGAVSGYPTLVMEQNARPGLTNRVLSRVARRVVIAFDEARPSLPRSKTMLLGNPVRRTIREQLEAAREAATERAEGEPLHLLVVGGSQGARGINRVLPATVQALLARGLKLEVIHQTGKLDADDVRADVKARGLEAQIRPQVFIDDMASAYAWADLVVCRAGATTVCELAVAQRPSVLIPFPYAADNHQEANARSLVDAGAALLQRQDEIEVEAFADRLAELLRDRERLARMADAAARVARPDAANDVVDLALSLVREPLVQPREGSS